MYTESARFLVRELHGLDTSVEQRIPPFAVMEAQQTFKYLKLEDGNMRLLEILPGFDYDEVRCRVHHFPVDQAAPYTAISYRWGTSSDRFTITLDSRPYEVMPNAW